MTLAPTNYFAISVTRIGRSRTSVAVPSARLTLRMCSRQYHDRLAHIGLPIQASMPVPVRRVPSHGAAAPCPGTLCVWCSQMSNDGIETARERMPQEKLLVRLNAQLRTGCQGAPTWPVQRRPLTGCECNLSTNGLIVPWSLVEANLPQRCYGTHFCVSNFSHVMIASAAARSASTNAPS